MSEESAAIAPPPTAADVLAKVKAQVKASAEEGKSPLVVTMVVRLYENDPPEADFIAGTRPVGWADLNRAAVALRRCFNRYLSDTRKKESE